MRVAEVSVFVVRKQRRVLVGHRGRERMRGTLGLLFHYCIAGNSVLYTGMLFRMLLLGCCVSALQAETFSPWGGDSSNQSPLTLDEEAFAEVRQEMKMSVPSDSCAARWREAMNAASPEARDVLLLLLLEQLNPSLPVAEHRQLYIAVLELHSRALAGHADACRSLAEALRRGRVESGLILPQDAESAAKLELRTAF